MMYSSGCDTSGSVRDMALSAPGEFDDREIIMRVFLLYTAELLTQFTVGQEQAQALAVIAVLVFLQDFFRFHDNLLSLVMQDQNIHPSANSIDIHFVVWMKHHNEALLPHALHTKALKNQTSALHVSSQIYFIIYSCIYYAASSRSTNQAAMTAMTTIAPGVNSGDTLLYGVEVKFYSMKLKLTPALETEVKNLFAVGDGAGVTRGLIQASISGVVAAREVMKRV